METMTNYLMNFVKPELLILIPIIYIIGMGLKKSNLSDKWIPFINGGVGITLSLMYIISTSDIYTFRDVTMLIFTGVTQGILVSGCSTYIDQLIKQYNKEE